MNKKYIIILLIGAIALLLNFSSCDNEVDIFSPDEEVTLIYGLLDADDATHTFKINRVFKGEEAIASLAQDPALSEYDNLNARLIEFNNSTLTDSTGNIWALNEKTVTNKDSGYFYYPTQKVYETDANLNAGKYYKIEVDKLDGSAIVESSTELINVNGAILNKPIGLGFIGLGLAGNDTTTESITLEMQMPINGKVMEVYLDFSYHDLYFDGSSGPMQTIQYKVGTYVSANVPTSSNDVEVIKGYLIPTSFYEFIAGKVSVVPDGSNIKYRIPEDTPLNFRFITGGDQFNTYLEVASPSTSLLETKPEYTNVINGVGLFSCRTFDNKEALMSSKSLEYLANGPFTEGRRFCHSTNTEPCN